MNQQERPTVGYRLRPALIVCGLSVLAALSSARAQTVEPVVLLEGQRIAACGARATFESGEGRRVVEIRLQRHGNGAELVILGEWRSENGPTIRLSALSVATASVSSAELAPAGLSNTDGVAQLKAQASDPRVTTFIQELMVSGATVQMRGDDADAVELRIAGPLPQSTRAAYLNCAGDLYRPGE